MKKRVFALLGWGLCCSLPAIAAPSIDFCVFDVMGENGSTMSVVKDYAVQAKQWNVEVRPKVYNQLQAAVQDFDSKKCDGLVADNFITRKYNTFAGSVGAVGAIPDYQIAQSVLSAVGSPKLAAKMRNKQYEIVGMIPYGLVYLMAKDNTINSLEKVKGHRIGILADDPSQKRMAEKVGMVPKFMTFDNGPQRFRAGEFDIVPAPLIIWEAFEGEKMLGANGGIADYPMVLMTMNAVVRSGKLSNQAAQQSRSWFAKQSPRLLKTVQQWDAKIPAKYWVNIPEIDRPAYDHLLSQLRKEFIANGTYDNSMMVLIRSFRCKRDPKFIECR